MSFRTVTLAVLSAILLNTVTGLRCEAEDGVYNFFDGEDRITPDRFHCMKITTDSPSTLQVLPPAEMVAPLTCSALQDGRESVKVRYERVEVNTGIMCTLECKVDLGMYRCRNKPSEGQCPCEPKRPSVIVKPISSELGPGILLGGQSDTLGGQNDPFNEVGAQTCDNKPAGFEFPDAVPCISIRAEVTKRRVKYIQGIQDDEQHCSVQTTTESETRYTQSSPDNVNLEGCVHVCKEAGPRCIQPTSAQGAQNLAQESSQCRCASPGMTKQLVPMEPLEVTARLGQTTCEMGECGPCGECDNGKCVLKENAHLGDHCPVCGEICPTEDERTRNHGGKLLCIPNVNIDCMEKRRGLFKPGRKYGPPGTEFPDLCTPGKMDAADTCGCAFGYMERPVSEQKVICESYV